MDKPEIHIKLWDIPIRLVHWAFPLLLAGLWWTGETGDLALHTKLGCAFLGLVLFRILWGFFGSETARFRSFVRGPSALLAYLRGSPTAQWIGHNPLGALSVILMLGLLSLQIGIGTIAQDVDGIESGPLSYLVSYETADAARNAHHILFNVILLVIGIHIAAVLFYVLVKKDKLITPMITGKKKVDGDTTQPIGGSAIAFMLCSGVSVAVAVWIFYGVTLP